MSAEATRLGVRLKVHIKVDTGMGRFGVVSDQLLDSSMNQDVQTVLDIAWLPHLKIEGIYTHFAAADSADKSYARSQLPLFRELLDQLKGRGFEAPLRHTTNSAATIELPDHIQGPKKVPFEVVTTANNHVFDYGLEGFYETQRIQTDNNIHSVGSGKDENEASKPLVVEVKGIRLDIVNFSEGEDRDYHSLLDHIVDSALARYNLI